MTSLLDCCECACWVSSLKALVSFSSAYMSQSHSLLPVSPTHTSIPPLQSQLSQVLLQEIRDSYGDRVTVEFDTQCTKAAWDVDAQTGEEVCSVTLEKNTNTNGPEGTYNVKMRQMNSRFVLGADGAQVCGCVLAC